MKVKWKYVGIMVLMILILFNASLTCYASGGYQSWVQGSEEYKELYGSLDDDFFDEIKQKLTEQDSWVSAVLGEVLAVVVNALWLIMDKAGMTIDHIILGKLYKNHSGIGIWQFGLDDNNIYGITASILYNNILNYGFALWILFFLVCLILCLLPMRKNGERLSRYKNALLDSITVLLGIYIMPQLVDLFIFFRDSLTSSMLIDIQSVTNSTTVSLLDCFAAVSVTTPSLTNSILFLIAVLSCFYFAYDYIKRAAICTGYYILFIIIDIMSIFNKSMLSSWVARMFGVLIIPLLDAILLMAPVVYMKVTAMSVANVELSEAIVALFLYMCLIPARNEILEMLKLKAASRGRNPLMQLALLASLGMTGGASAGALAGGVAANGSAAAAAAAGAEAATNATAANMTNAIAAGATNAVAIEGPSKMALTEGVNSIGAVKELELEGAASEKFNPENIGTSLEEVMASEEFDKNIFEQESAGQTGSETIEVSDAETGINSSTLTDLDENSIGEIGTEFGTNVVNEDDRILSPREQNLMNIDNTSREIADLESQIMKDRERVPIERNENQKAMDAINHERENISHKNNFLNGDIEKLEQKNNKMLKENEEMKASETPLDKHSAQRLERNEKNIHNNNAIIAEKRATIENNNAKIEELNQKMNQKRDEIAQKEADRIHTQNQLKEAQKRMDDYSKKEQAFARESEMNGLGYRTYGSLADYQIQAARDSKMKQLANYQNFDNRNYSGVLSHQERAEFYQERLKAEKERRAKQMGVMVAAGTAGFLLSAPAGGDEAITTAASAARIGMVAGKGIGDKIASTPISSKTTSKNVTANPANSMSKANINTGKTPSMGDLYQDMKKNAQAAEDLLDDVTGRKD